MAGRKKRPVAARKLEGRRNLIKEPKQDPATAWIPDWLPPEGKKFLKEHGPRLRAELGIKALDEPMLFMIAATYGNAISAQKKINEEGLVAPDRDADVMRKNPHESIMRAQVQLFITAATKYGMSPVDRLRLLQPAKEKDEADNLLDGGFKRGEPDWKVQ